MSYYPPSTGFQGASQQPYLFGGAAYDPFTSSSGYPQAQVMIIFTLFDVLSCGVVVQYSNVKIGEVQAGCLLTCHFRTFSDLLLDIDI